jgi:hypothetical protein
VLEERVEKSIPDERPDKRSKARDQEREIASRYKIPKHKGKRNRYRQY